MMLSKRLVGLLALAALLAQAGAAWCVPGKTVVASALWPQPPRLSAKAAVLYDPVSREVLAADDRAFVSMPPASTTKILTCLVVLEACELSEVVTVSQRAAATGGARVGLRRGQQLLVEDLLYGLMLRSGNDVAVALAEHVAGSVEEFAEMMNATAKRLGALATNMVNPHGLTAAGHETTAYDLAIIAAAALEHPVFRALVSSQEHEIGSLDPAWTSLVRNTNQLLWSYEGADGVKTGTTREAGQCLVASATRDDRQLIAVVLRSGNRWGDSARLLTYGFETTSLVVAGRRGDVVMTTTARDPVNLSWAARPVEWQVPVDIALGSTLAYTHPASEEPEIGLSYQLEPNLQLPLAAGQTVGLARLADRGRPVAESPLLVADAWARGVVYQRGLQSISNMVLLYLRQGLR